MTRAERIRKLGNAIKRYRGRYHPTTGKWIEAPQLSAKQDVRRWAESLGLNPNDTVVAVDGFKSFPEMRSWMQAL